MGGLLLAEAGIRWIAPQDLEYFDATRFFEPNAGAFEQFVPHVSGRYAGVPVRINALGLRDRELAVPKPRGTFRVLAIGDSVTFGFGVRLEDTWVKQLEGRLRASRPGHTVEVVNAGMGGTGLDYYLHVLRTRAEQLEPDLVLVAVVLNDILDYEHPAPRGPSAVAWASWVRYFLATHSHLYLVINDRLKSFLYGHGWIDINTTHAEHLLMIAPSSEQQPRAWASSLLLLDRLIAEARDRRIPLALVVFPMEMQLDAGTVALYREQLGFRLSVDVLDAAPQRRLAEFARAHEVPLVDLLPRFRTSGRGLYYRNASVSLDWVHPSVAGHRLAAAEIFSTLEAARALTPFSSW